MPDSTLAPLADSLPDPTAPRARQPLPFGAQRLDDGRTRFRLWAPSCTEVELEVDGEHVTMDARDGGWFESEVRCGPGARYRFKVRDGLLVPDPASRFQPEDVHGPSEVIDPAAYLWQHTEWRGRPWEDTVLLEVHVGVLGGYRGVQERLDEWAALGITAIELMPVGEFPGRRNWGYDGVLPYAPESAYGRPEDLKALIDAAHGHGLMVFLDVVYNHFGPDGNYLHVYADAFFRHDADTPWGPAIDFERPEVRDYFFDNALYWLNEYRFDGLRLDAVHAIDNDRWLRELSQRVRAATPPGRYIHLVLEDERNTASLLDGGRGGTVGGAFTAQWNDDVHNALHALLTGETESYYAAFADRPITKLARALSEGFAYQGEASPVHDGKPRGERSAHLPPTAFVAFLQNHDQVGNRALGERLVALCDTRALLAATALLLLAPQIPLLFMGEEFGSAQPFLFFTDYTGALAEAVREGRRKEFARFGAFADHERRALLPDPNDERTFDLSKPRYADSYCGDALHWRHYYKSALTVRNRLIVPRLKGTRAIAANVLSRAAPERAEAEPPAARGGARLHGTAPRLQEADALVMRWRLGDGEILSIAVNLSGDAVPFDAHTVERTEGQLIFETPPRARDAVETDELPPYACVAYLTGDFAPVLALTPIPRGDPYDHSDRGGGQ
jgi:maltooligosyltrehalose trehalohydrolase